MPFKPGPFTDDCNATHTNDAEQTPERKQKQAMQELGDASGQLVPTQRGKCNFDYSLPDKENAHRQLLKGRLSQKMSTVLRCNTMQHGADLHSGD